MSFTIFYLIFVIAAWIYEYLAEASIKKKAKLPGKRVAKWSYTLMAGSYILLLIATPLEYFIVKRDINPIITSIGLIMYLLGLSIRRWAVWTLAEFFSLHIEIKEKHQLIKDGPYRYVRHPNYLATIMKGVGFLLIPNSFYMIFYAILIFIPIRIVRIYLEEKELIKEFGQEYLNYKKEVYALLPFKKIRLVHSLQKDKGER